jgi:uncharacterized protein YbaP (TraB family)
MRALIALFAACLCAVALGQSAPSNASLDEVVVTGERAGPGLWHVSGKGAGQMWIMGSVSPLPKDMTWRSRQLEGILEHTDRVLVARPVDIGIARALWLLMTQRSLLLAGKDKKLKDVLPPDLYARFAHQRLRFTNEADKWEKYRPIIASIFLEEEALHRVGLSTKLDLGEEVRSLARKHHVHIEEFKIGGVNDLLQALKVLPSATENKCVAASLATLESGLPRLTERAKAWATGDVEKIQSLPESSEVAACRVALTLDRASGNLYEQLKRKWMNNMLQQLERGGTTVSLVSMDMLLEQNGFVDQLRAAGYQVDPP